jgi:hypothetical protein
LVSAFRRKLSVGSAIVLLVAAVLTTVAAGAQTQNAGTISGNVLDPTGAVIPNANVTLTSRAEGTVVKAKSNSRGEYLFDAVKPGSYTLTVAAPTFQNFTADGVEVNAAENVRIDAKLPTGSSSETVTVEANSVTVDTRSGTIATVIDPTLVQELPVDGNNIVALAALLPGVTNVNAPTTFTSDTGGPTYNVNGSRGNQNVFLFDGILWNNLYTFTGLNFPPIYMLQEVSIQLSNFKAQYGRSVGSVFNALTRTGSNAIHGDVWEYFQNRDLNASDYIAQRNPELVQNQFGATVGGPIKRDKMFFFVGYQDLRAVTEVDSKVAAPTFAELGMNNDGTARPCVDPYFASVGTGACASFYQDVTATTNALTSFSIANASAGLRSPFSGNGADTTVAPSQLQSTYVAQGGTQPQSPCIQALQNDSNPAVNPYANTQGYLGSTVGNMGTAEIPTICFNPVSLNVIKNFVTPQASQNTSVTPIPQITSSAKQPRNDQDGFVRVDLDHLGRHSIDARFYVTNVNDLTANGASANSLSYANYEIDSNKAGIYNGNIGDTWVLTSNILNTARASYRRYGYSIIPTDPRTLVSLGSNFTDPGVPALPRISVGGRFNFGSTASNYSYSLNAATELDDNVSWQHGNHTFAFGAQFLDLNYIHRFDTAYYATVGGQFTGVALADFLMGFIASESVGNSTNISAVQHAAYFYAQDDWRISSRLTLNLGLRYELPKPWYQPDGQSVTFFPGYQSYRFANVIPDLAFQNDPGVPNSIIKTNYDNIGPRFGLAYDLFGNGRTALRAGFGLFFENLNANTVGIGEPYHYQASYAYPNGSLSNPLLGQNPVPANYSGPASAAFTYPYTVNFADRNVTEPYTYAVNFGLQQQIKHTATLEANYVGKFGRHQIVPYDLNPDIYDCSGSNYTANPTLYCPGGPLPANPTNNAIQTVQSVGQSPGSQIGRVTYPGFNYGGQGIVDNNSVGSSNYNAVQVIYIQRARKSLTTTMSYTYSRSLDDQSSGTTNTAAVPGTPNVNTNYGPSDYNSTQILNAGWTLHLPTLTTGNAFERAVLNDWSFGGIFNARTGQPINVTTANDYEFTAEGSQRPPLAPGVSHYTALPSNRHRSCAATTQPYCKVQEWFNPCEFSNGANGNATVVGGVTVLPSAGYCNVYPIIPGYKNGVSRNIVVGPAFLETDFSLRRNFDLHERGMRLEMRLDAFNVWNTPNLANPSGSITSAAGSLEANVVSTAGKNSTAGTGGRRVQIAAIFHY